MGVSFEWVVVWEKLAPFCHYPLVLSFQVIVPYQKHSERKNRKQGSGFLQRRSAEHVCFLPLAQMLEWLSMVAVDQFPCGV